MERVRAREAGAFERLYDSFSRVVYGVALRILSDAPSAEDVTQAVFLKVWSAPESFHGGNLPGWLIRVTRNRALDVLRSRAAHPQVEIATDMPEDDALEDTAFKHMNCQIVRDAMERLPEAERALIDLGFFGGLTHQELARRTGAPLGTVKTRIRSALRKLRTMLDGVTV
jgi:RNA polymerase sigma-70 factor, ECF subfamily